MANDNKENKSKAVVQYKGEPITITFDDVKNLICPLADVKEVAVFLKTCQSLQLNPFASEIYLIKYSERDKAAQVIAIDSYLKAAESNDKYDGHEAGIILKDTAGKLEFREGSFLLDEEKAKLVGGWARIHRKDRGRPFYISVNKRECLRYKKDGALTEFWREEKQPSMLRKTALKRALVEAFPSLFAGFISDVEYEEIPEEVEERLPKPKGEMEEGELHPAYTTLEGELDWKKFWARQAERDIDGVKAHALLKVGSIKLDLLDKGKTLEEVDEMITKALEAEEKKTRPKETRAAKEEKSPDEITKDDVPDLNAVLKLCFHYWGLQPAQVIKELGYKTMMEIAEPPWECWLKIKAVYRASQ